MSLTALLLSAGPALASAAEAAPRVEGGVWVIVALSAAPFLAVLTTAFTKALILLGALRAGLGQPGALPVVITTGLAALLAAWVMRPVAVEISAAVGAVTLSSPDQISDAASRGWPPLERFLTAHTQPEDAAAVAELSQRLGGAADPDPIDRVMAFLLSELDAAFRMAALLLLPFVLVDLLVANVLVIAGLNLTPPGLIAFPLKLLLFVTADGWGLLLRGFASGYAG